MDLFERSVMVGDDLKLKPEILNVPFDWSVFQSVTQPVKQVIISQTTLFHDDLFLTTVEILHRAKTYGLLAGVAVAEYLVTRQHLINLALAEYAILFLGDIWLSQIGGSFHACYLTTCRGRTRELNWLNLSTVFNCEPGLFRPLVATIS